MAGKGIFNVSDSMIFRGGMPYGPDVNKLKEVFPVPSLTEGRTISHEELEKATGYTKGTQRYYGVINSWCANQKNQFGIVIEWEAGKGLAVLRPHEKLSGVEKKTQQVRRQFSRQAREIRWVPRERLDEIGQQRYDHDLMCLTRSEQALRAEMKKLPIDLAPVKSLPKPKLVQAS